jgi:hypothetical protein
MPGRTTKPRSATVGRTSGSAALTGAAGTFQRSDVGKAISGTGIPAGATITAVASATAATLSANATTTTSGAATIGLVSGTGTTVGAATAEQAAAAQKVGFFGFSPESDAEADSYSVAAVNAGTVDPGRVTSPNSEAPYLTPRVES